MLTNTYNPNGTIPQQNIRTAPSRFLRERTRPNYEIGGVIEVLPEPSYPYKYLPILWWNTDRSEGIVINGGTICSSIDAYGATASSGSFDVPNSSGTLPIFTSKTTGSVVTANIDDSFFTYPESLARLLIPCNGGHAMTYTYTDYDGSSYAARLSPASTAIASGDTLAIPANYPVGVTYADVYYDARGQWLNFDTTLPWGVWTKAYIRVPYVDTTSFLSETGYNFGADSTYADASGAYHGVWKAHSFAHGAMSAHAVGAQYVVSDRTGKFELDAGTSPTLNTAGKIMALDCRFPKDLNHMVNQYPGITLSGDATYGLPTALYLFIYDSITTATGTAPTAAQTIDYVRKGVFGEAHILINI